jgi:hypothetical protein
MARRGDPITPDEAGALNVTVPHRRVTSRNGSFRRGRRPHPGFRPEPISQILAINPAALLFSLSSVPDHFDLLEKLLVVAPIC